MSTDSNLINRRIVFVGDSWLEKIHILFKAVIADGTFEYISRKDFDALDSKERKARLKGAADVVATQGDNLPKELKAKHFVPPFWIDGLASLEYAVVSGARVILGRDVLDGALADYQDVEIQRAMMRGDVDFLCKSRFSTSIEALVDLESRPKTVAISDFILGAYKLRPILNGVTRPLPEVTMEMAARLAVALGGNRQAFEKASHYQLGRVAYMPSKSAFLPFDSNRLGLKYETDPHWFANGLAIFADLVATLPEEQRKPVKQRSSMRFVSTAARQMTEEQVRFDTAVETDDHVEIVAAARALRAMRDRMHDVDRRKSDMAFLRSAYALDLGAEAIQEVLDLQKENLDRDVVRVLANHCQTKGALDQFDPIIDLAQRAYLPGLKVVKLRNRKEFLLSKAAKETAEMNP